jgi:hypothetical protein
MRTRPETKDCWRMVTSTGGDCSSSTPVNQAKAARAGTPLIRGTPDVPPFRYVPGRWVEMSRVWSRSLAGTQERRQQCLRQLPHQWLQRSTARILEGPDPTRMSDCATLPRQTCEVIFDWLRFTGQRNSFHLFLLENYVPVAARYPVPVGEPNLARRNWTA